MKKTKRFLAGFLVTVLFASTPMAPVYALESIDGTETVKTTPKMETENIVEGSYTQEESINFETEDVPEEMETEQGMVEKNEEIQPRTGATEILYSGKSGDLDWSIDSNGHLVISGIGDYNISYSPDYGYRTDWGEYSDMIISAEVNVKGIKSTRMMFYFFESLTTVDLGGLDTSQVTDMSHMFYSCDVLRDLDLSNFNTSQVTDMSDMFAYCSGLNSLDLSNFNTSQVTNMSSMFHYCDALINLDVSSFDTSQVTNMSCMFSLCDTLTNLDVSSFDTGRVESMFHMFEGCDKLKSLNLRNFDTSQVTDMSNMFSGCRELSNLDVSSFNTSKIRHIGMIGMFRDCYALKSLDLSSFDTSNVTDMSEMFSYCKTLSDLDLSSFDTSNVTDMSEMFYYCDTLNDLDLSSFDTSNVTDMSKMFYYCDTLNDLDLSSFDTSNVTDMSEMFYYCDTLSDLDLSGFDTSQVTDMSGMFACCMGLSSLDLSSFNMSQVSVSYNMFESCHDLETIYTPINVNIYVELPDYHEWKDISGNEYTQLPKNTNKSIHISTLDFSEHVILTNQTTTWYDIWCLEDVYKSYTRGFDLHIGDQTLNTGNSFKANADIPLDQCHQVSVSKENYHTCDIPMELVYTCHEVVLYPSTKTEPFIQFVTAKESSSSTYVNLACSPMSLYTNSLNTYDFFVDVNWNGDSPGDIYLKQGDKSIKLEDGENKSLLLGNTFTKDGGDIYLQYSTKDGRSWNHGLKINVYESGTSSIKIDAGETASGENKKSAKEDEMWGDMKFSFDLLSDSIPVELTLDPINAHKGTFKGTLGIKIDNVDVKVSLFDAVKDQVKGLKSKPHKAYTTIDKEIKKLKKKGIKAESTVNQFVVEASTQLMGYMEGTYEIGADGSLINMDFTESGVAMALDGEISTVRQYFPFPWFWELMVKAQLGMKLNFEHEFDGTSAVVAPLELRDSSLGIEAGAGVGISGAASIGVAGSGEIHLDGQVLPIDTSKLEMYADYTIKLGAFELGPWSGNFKKINSDRYYILKDGRWFVGEIGKSATGGGFRTLGLREQSPEMHLISRDYINATSEFTANVGSGIGMFALGADEFDIATVKTNTYTFTEPQLVQFSDGSKLMVWVDDPGEEIRPLSINRSTMFYSFYDGNEWSEPAMVVNDGTADSHPTLKEFNDQAYLVWINVNKELNDESTYEEYCQAMDIAYAKFNSETKIFEDIATPEENTYADTMPDITVINASPVVVWTQNSESNVFHSTGTNTIYVAELIDGEWNVSSLISGLGAVDGLGITNENDEYVVYYSTDTDGDIATIEDKEIFKTDASGVEQAMTENETADTKPIKINGHLYWYSDGSLTNGEENITLGTSTDRYYWAVNGEQIAVLYTKMNDDYSSTVYANYYDGHVWSNPVVIIETSNFIPELSCIMDSNGNLQVVTNEIEFVDETFGEATLNLYTIKERCDLSVSDFSYDPIAFSRNSSLEWAGNIKNNGTNTVKSVDVYVYQGDSLLKNETVNVNLIAGGETDLYLTCDAPQDFSNKNIVIKVWPTDLEDCNEADNAYECEIRTNDVSVEKVTAELLNETASVSAYISNKGYDDLSNIKVSVRQDSAEGAELATHTISSLAVDKGETLEFDLNVSSDIVVYVVAEIEEDENLYSNNQNFSLVAEKEAIQVSDEVQEEHEHTWADEYTVVKEASCTEDGLKVRYCTKTGCDEKIDEKVIEELGHSYGNPTFEWDEDYSSCQAVFVCVKDEFIQTLECLVTLETQSAAEIIYKASIELDGKKYVDTKVKEIKPSVKKPSPVGNLKAVSAGKNRVKLTWTASSGAEGYLVYAQKDGKYGYVGMTTKGTSYTDTKALDADYNFYWVFPYVKDSTDKMHPGGCTKYVYAKGVCPAVTNLKASSVSGGVKLTWTAAAGAEGYLVYGIENGGQYGYVGMTSGTTFTAKKASKTVYNFYWIFPYHKNAEGKMITGGVAPYTYGRAK